MIAPMIRRYVASSTRPKISLIGSGQIGSILGILAGLKNLGDVCLFDVVTGIAKGKALDMNQLTAIEGVTSYYEGITSLDALRNTDVAIITAGIPRKPGMSRTDLISTNAKVISEVAHAVKSYCPGAFVICVTNPLDAMVYLFQKESQLPHSKVVGMAGILDSARFKFFLAQELGVSTENIQSLVLGGHADSMILLSRYTTVAGISMSELIQMGLITEKKIHEIIERTRFGGQEIVNLLKNGSAFFTPASAAIQMAEAYIRDKKMILPCAAYLDGQYGIKGIYAGVPVKIGAKGVEKVYELSLNAAEKKEFLESVGEVEKLIKSLESIIQNKAKTS